jgi:hypothetical protein
MNSIKGIYVGMRLRAWVDDAYAILNLKKDQILEILSVDEGDMDADVWCGTSKGNWYVPAKPSDMFDTEFEDVSKSHQFQDLYDKLL